MIRAAITGFEVFDRRGNLAAHCQTFAEASDLHAQVDPPRKFKRTRIKGEKAERRGGAVQCFSESKPHTSLSMACHPNQVKEFNERCEREGRRGTRYREDGTPIFTSKRAFNEELKARGLLDGDAGYSTHAG